MLVQKHLRCVADASQRSERCQLLALARFSVSIVLLYQHQRRSLSVSYQALLLAHDL